MAIAVPLVAIAMIIYIGLFDPEEYPAPQCLFHRLTGYDCPGCGTQRAVHALLHGRVAEAWRHNAALFPAVAVAVLYAWRPKRLRRWLYATATPYVIAALLALWWVGRNL